MVEKERRRRGEGKEKARRSSVVLVGVPHTVNTRFTIHGQLN
jgi:hypothetical protein